MIPQWAAGLSFSAGDFAGAAMLPLTANGDSCRWHFHGMPTTPCGTLARAATTTGRLTEDRWDGTIRT